MKPSFIWREHGPGVAAISQSGNVIVRLLGLPFAAAGVYFLAIFLDGALHPSRGELTIFGWILLPLLGVALLAPGWAFLFARKRVRLDASRREATEEIDLLIYTRGTTSSISGDAQVMLRYEVGSSKEAATTFTHVYLVPARSTASPQPRRRSNPALVRLAMLSPEQDDAALELAQRVGRFFGIGVEDRRVKRGEVTSGGIVVERLDPDEAD